MKASNSRRANRGTPPQKAGGLRSLLALIAGAVFLLIALAYAYEQSRLPSVGAVLVPNNAIAWHDDGIMVEVLEDDEYGAQHGGLLDGDIIVAIDNRPLTEWAPRVVMGSGASDWRMGDVAPVTVRRDRRELALALPLRDYPLLAAVRGTWSVLVFAAVTFLVGAFVLWRRPYLVVARVIFLWGAALLAAMTWALGLDVLQLMYSRIFYLYTATACAAYMLFWSSGLHLSLIFPTAHPRLRGREHLAWLVHPLAGAVLLAIAILRLSRGDPMSWLSALLRSVDLVSLPTGGLMIVVFIWGYWRYYDADSRRRARIFLFAAILCGGLGIVLWNLAPLIVGRPLLSTNVAGLLLIPAPVALAVSIVRHKLLDIDVIIRRTLIYTVLTTTLALIYLTSVVILQFLLRTLAGGFSNLAIVLSTLAIATLFSPLRGWIQAVIDRRFYRSKYDARATMVQFAEAARNEVDLDALSAELLDLIRKTMQPEFVSLWLMEEKGMRAPLRD